MARFAAGDSRAFVALVERWEAPARRYAYRCFGDHQIAEDVAQEAFVRLHGSAARYRPTARFNTYFYTIIGNLCRDRARKRKRRTDRGVVRDEAVELTELTDGAPHLQPDELAMIAEQRELVRAAVATLPTKLMEALSLREFEGLAYREIADVMDANLGEVKTWIHRARKKLAERLRAVLQREGID